MYKTFTLLFLTLFTISVNAQNIADVLPFGKIDTADLRMTTCSFEKDANAMVLFDKADVNIDEYGVIKFIHHKRIKIFNDNGKKEANITLSFIDDITDIKAETINLKGQKIEFTQVDPNLIYKQKISKNLKSLTFAFPDVKNGSVIEFSYIWKIYTWYLPFWFFQSNIPQRYSEIKTSINLFSHIEVAYNVNQPFVKDSDDVIGPKNNPAGVIHKRAISNVPSFKEEPFMTPINDNLPRVIFKSTRASWFKVHRDLLNDDDFGKQFIYRLPDEKDILAKIRLLKNKELIIDSIFNLVKNRMTWNKEDEWYTIDGIHKAWGKKTGNSTEINLILYRLLSEAGIKAFPMVLSTPDNGNIDVNNPNLSQFDKTVICATPDTTHIYIMDATNKHNLYNQVPLELLSLYGLVIYPNKPLFYNLLRISSDTLSKETVYITADIKPDGKMTGTANIFSEGYNRASKSQLYKSIGEKKYIDNLCNHNNDLKVTSFKLENMDNDTLGMAETADFTLNLSASDERYIYFNPNMFSSLGDNPFLSENRFSDIDFLFKNKYVIAGRYIIPNGYKADVLPANHIIISRDKSISFERIAGVQDNAVQLRYVITRTKILYNKEEYPTLHEFYKQLYELLNEQIVLKKL
jgi:hypothetical protein